MTLSLLICSAAALTADEGFVLNVGVFSLYVIILCALLLVRVLVLVVVVLVVLL